ncbi:MAG: hypothetical protein RR549_01765 [Oscillospiraceae bacterium]
MANKTPLKQLIKPVLKTKGNEVYFAHDDCKFYILNNVFKEEISSNSSNKFEEIVSNLCYDANKNCFWGCSENADNMIYKLDKEVNIIGRIINTNHSNCFNKPVGICHNNFTDTILVAYKNEIVILSDQGNYITSLKSVNNITDIACYFSFIYILSNNTIIALKYNGFKVWEQEIDYDDEFLCLQANENYYDRTEFMVLGKKNLYHLKIYHI